VPNFLPAGDPHRRPAPPHRRTSMKKSPRTIGRNLPRTSRRRRTHLFMERLEDRTLLSHSALSPTLPALVTDPDSAASVSVSVRVRPAAAHMTPADIVPGASNAKEFSVVPGLHVVRLGEDTTVDQALAGFRANRNVLYAQPNYQVHVMLTPNDPGYPNLY